MKQRILTFLLALLSVSVWGNAWGQGEDVDKSWYKGNYDSFTISKPEELVELADLVNNDNVNFEGKTIILGDNIDLSGMEWTPIGTKAHNSFKGTFDGNNKSINNLSITSNNNEFSGLFGYVEDDGCIKNLSVSGKIDATKFAGGICAYSSGIIENCHSYVNIVLDDSYQDQIIIGGICGQSQNNILNCSNNGILEVHTTDSEEMFQVFIGGICGLLDSYNSLSIVRNCFNQAFIDIKIEKFAMSYAEQCLIGGIVGKNETNIIENCYNIGNVECNINNDISSVKDFGVGGLVGGQSGYNGKLSKTINSYNKCSFDISGNIKDYCGLICGKNNVLFWVGIINQIINSYCWDFSDGWKIIGNNGENNILETDKKPSIEGIDSFTGGEIAWLLRDAGFGQDLQDENIQSPTLLFFTPGKEVYKLTLMYEQSKTKEIYRNSKYLDLPETGLEPIEGKIAGWIDEKTGKYILMILK